MHSKEGREVSPGAFVTSGIKPKRAGLRLIVTVSLIYAAIIALTISLTVINNDNMRKMLEDSVESELLAVAFAAQNIVNDDIGLFEQIDSQADIAKHKARHDRLVSRLRELRDEVGAKYIYAIKEVDGRWCFVYDTDEAVDTEGTFEEYVPSQIHLDAAGGAPKAGILAVTDKWGTFNSGAVPIYGSAGEAGDILGVVSVDFEDKFLSPAIESFSTSETFMISVLALSLVLLFLALLLFTIRNSQMQNALYRMANSDSTTGLHNRFHTYSYLADKEALLKSERPPFAAVFIDMDNFKKVNDGAGHEAGDEVLCMVARVLSEASANADATAGAAAGGRLDSFTARIGGDEFLQIIAGIDSEESADAFAENLLDSFRTSPELLPYIRRYGLGLSIGISLFPRDSEDYEILIRNSDIAMYYAKEHGKNSYKVYNEEMDEDVEDSELIIRKRG